MSANRNSGRSPRSAADRRKLDEAKARTSRSPPSSRPGVRRRGRSAAISSSTRDGNFHGSVSGGCVEGAVVTEALDIIGAGGSRCWNSASPTRPPGGSACPAAAASRSMSSGWADGSACAEETQCGAPRAPRGDPGHRSRRRPRPRRRGGRRRRGRARRGDRQGDSAPALPVRSRRKGGTSSSTCTCRSRKLVAIGAVHISQALAPMAKIAGFDMEIIDPRTAFATPGPVSRRAAACRMAGGRAEAAAARRLHGARRADA